MYKRILARKNSSIANQLLLQAIATIGAPSVALDETHRIFPDSETLSNTFIGDMAMKRIHWKEPKHAIGYLAHLMYTSDILRNRYDYLIARAENDDMEEVLKQYQSLVDDDAYLPRWIKENTGKAYEVNPSDCTK